MTNDRSLSPVQTYRDFIAGQSVAKKARGFARDAAVRALSAFQFLPGVGGGARGGWIRFPFYHHVFDDERNGFARHLDFMASQGDFIGLDDAVAMVSSGGPIDGHYFCVTFDDGFKNWITNAMPILLEKKAPAAFFVVTGYIGTSLDLDREKLLRFHDGGNLLMEFLDWDDCRAMNDAGMTIGSHTINHVHLAELDDDAARTEITGSKQAIEKELGRACDHFCCPFGREGVDYDASSHPDLVRRVGYRSFLTGHRGAMVQGGSSMLIRRDHLLAGWGNHQLKYFFSS